MKRYIILILFLLLTLTACGDAYPYTAADYGEEKRAAFVQAERWIETGGGTLCCGLEWLPSQEASHHPYLHVNEAHIQRWRDGYWWDIGQTLALTGPGDRFDLDLTDGYYRLAIPFEEGKYVSYEFGVGSLTKLSARDLPAGRPIVPAENVSFELLDGALYPDSYAVSYRETYGEHTNYNCYREAYYEVKLDSQWCQLPWVNVGISSAIVCWSYDMRNTTEVFHYAYNRNHREREDYRETPYYFFPLAPGEYRIVGTAWGGMDGYLALPSFTIPEGSSSITSQLGQRYEYTDLRYQEGLFRATASKRLEPLATVGLHRETGRLIVAYELFEGTRFWLECYETDQAPTDKTWLTTEDTATVVLEAADGQRYAVTMHGEKLTVEEMMQQARIVQVWLPGAEAPVTVPCASNNENWRKHSPWEQSGDLSDFRVETYSVVTELYPDGTWRLQELVDGHWHDRAEHGAGLQYDTHAVWGSLELELPAGTYRLMLTVNEAEGAFVEMPFYFSVP